MAQKTTVIIVGAGPAGLATSACLNLQNIPNIILEKEDCYGSLWQKRAYDRLKLHLAKQFCELPYFPFPPSSPTYIPKNGFVQYLDDYISHFNVTPYYNCEVVSAWYDQSDGNWVVLAKDSQCGTTEKWLSKFLVVASGASSEGYIPPVEGLESFTGEVMHSNAYKNGKRFEKKSVLVVGSGDSGMEVAFDLSNYGANASIVVRGRVHVLNEGLVRLGMVLMQYIPVNLVDIVVEILGRWKYGDLSGYGFERPSEGPFYLLKNIGRAPIIDVGTINKIRANEIKVMPSIETVNGDSVHFINGVKKPYDAIVFATGYKSTVGKWLEDDGGLFGQDGLPIKFAQWKGEKGIYCAGFARSGIYGIAREAKAIAGDIQEILSHRDVRK